MSSPILFRSLKSGKDRAGSAHSIIRWRGTSWSHIRSYTDKDNTRDIVWTKIRPDGLSVREREDNGDFEIITYWMYSSYDEFYAINPTDSKKYAIQKARHILKMSAKFWQYSYREFFGESGLQELRKNQPMNTLIFICNAQVDESLKSLAFHNDLIYLDIFHPFEINPDSSYLFLWQIINLKSYKKSYQTFQNSKKSLLKKIHGSYIALSTLDKIDEVLNSFFKKRYHHE